MSEPRKRSAGIRLVRFFLGIDEPVFIAGAAGAIVAIGMIVMFHIVYFSPPPSPPLWQTIGTGIAIGLLLMPFFFMSIARTIPFMSHWAALALMTAAGIFPLLMWYLRALEVTQFFFLVVSFTYIATAILVARLIVIRQRRSSR